jgi:DNA-binding transcriptional regulator YhcF (GntR family)
MVALSVDCLFDAAVRIQVEERSVSITFTPDAISIKFPTTRRLADFLNVPHYYVLPYFAMMEQEELVTRAERVGILTTAKGSRKMIALMNAQYRQDIEAIIGQAIFSELAKRCEPAL